MAIHLCPGDEKLIRSITNGPILLHLGKGGFRPAPQIRFMDVMIQRPFPVGFFANQNYSEAMANFIAESKKESLLFFNVSNFLENPGQGEAKNTILFFNVGFDEDLNYGEAEGSILFFNVAEFIEPVKGEAGGTILYFNVSEG